MEFDPFHASNNEIRRRLSLLQGSNQPLFTSRKIHSRDEFAIFVSVLLRVIKSSGDFVLVERAKRAIRLCTTYNRASFSPTLTPPLVEITAQLLRSVVGKVYWRRAETMTNIFLKEKVGASLTGIGHIILYQHMNHVADPSEHHPLPMISFHSTILPNK